MEESFVLNNALSVLESQTKRLEQDHLEKLRGPAGLRGERGLTGAPGRDAKEVKLVIGRVITGDEAAARIREEGGAFVLDLCLPKADPGPRGLLGLPGKDAVAKDGKDGESVVGPAGRPGRDGVDAAPISNKDVENAIRKILEQNPEKFRGLAGESIIGSKGERGEPGMTREEIGQTIIEVLSNAGVITEQAEKLIRVKTALRTALNKATSRAQAEMQDLVRKVDEILE